jgi:glucokinase
VNVLVPDVVIVGGGVAAADSVLLDPLRKAIRRRAPLVPPGRIRVAAAELGPWAGAIGAALAGAGGAGRGAAPGVSPAAAPSVP